MDEQNQNAPAEQTAATAPEAPVTYQSQVTRSETAPADQTPADVDKTGGVEEGSVEKTSETVPVEVRDRIDHEEKVVHDTDSDGNVVGWHKVPADGSTPVEQEGVFDASKANTEEGTN
jgi:hypothetical protein